MLAWFANNLGTIIVLAVLIAVLLLVIFSIRKSKKNGKSTCGCGSGCGACPMSGKCHSGSNTQVSNGKD